MNPGWHYLNAERLCVANEHLPIQLARQAGLALAQLQLQLRTISLKAVWAISVLGLRMLG